MQLLRRHLEKVIGIILGISMVILIFMLARDYYRFGNDARCFSESCKSY